MTLSTTDLHHLRAAEGWLGLGDFQSAHDELENITASLRAHPAVLQIRHGIFSEAEKWGHALTIAEALVNLLPDDPYGWIHRSFALHEMKRTAEAQEKLRPAADKFPTEKIIFYNLACYACQLGERKEALKLLGKAIDLASKNDIRLKALEDPDLEPLWKDISEI